MLCLVITTKNFLGTCILWAVIVPTPKISSSLDLNVTTRACEDRTWRIGFSWWANHSSKTKYSSTRQYNNNKKKMFALVSLVLSMKFMMGKPLHVEIDNGKFGHLQKCRQVVAKLCDHLSGYKNYKVFFDNWFTTLDLMHHFKSKGIHAVSTIQLNRLRLSSWCKQRSHEKWLRRYRLPLW